MSDEADNIPIPTTTVGRRGLLKCMAGAGTGVLWTLSGGVAQSILVSEAVATTGAKTLSFVQISDTHVGFDKAANPDALGTLRQAITRVKAMSDPPSFIIHTGDITHLSTPEQFDLADQTLKDLNLPIFHIPGEHDTLDGGNGKLFLDRYGAGTKGSGWYSFDKSGVHFIALVNVVDLLPNGQGRLGDDQIKWLADDVANLSSSTPIVVFAHMPLWNVYEPWGWGTGDAAPALTHLKRFGSVTVLNGHIHQVITKVEGAVTFHTARSTAFPQAAPGTPGASPGPMKVPAEQLRGVLGVRQVIEATRLGPFAVIDQTLA